MTSSIAEDYMRFAFNMFKKHSIALPNPFPTQVLRKLNFGSADGHRDPLNLETIVVTSSVRTFLENRHSIIVGAIGAGKSTLFRFLKNHSSKLENYKKDLIVPLEESLSFSELAQFAKDHYCDKDEKLLFRLVWKFNILNKIATEISSLENFPASKDEDSVNRFLRECNSANHHEDMLGKIKRIFSDAHITLEAKIFDSNISLDAGINQKSKTTSKKINLEEVQAAISKTIKGRGLERATVIIDKIDKFVAGIEYQIQRNFITSLLEVEDDLACDKNIKLKIFLRSDLFERLHFSSLGYDKVVDNVVFLRWSKDETLRFLAHRIVFALAEARIATLNQLIQSSNLKEYELSLTERLQISDKVPNFLKRAITRKPQMERQIGLFGKFDKSIITKIFPRKVIHYSNSNQKYEEIDTFHFIETHFLDGNNICTPRYMLTFIKEVTAKAAAYYDENPDQTSNLLSIDSSKEWDLFKKKCVYEGYNAAKQIFIANICSVDAKWSGNLSLLMNRKGNKTNIDFRWLRANINDISEEDAVDFLSFMQVVGFLRVSESHTDIRKRGYELPMLYKPYPALQNNNEEVNIR